MKSLLLLLTLAVTLPTSPVAAQPAASSPAAAVKARVAALRAITINFDEPVPAVYAAVRSNPGAFLAGPEALDSVANMKDWSLRKKGDEWPLHYNDATGTWEWMPTQFKECSDAQIAFAETFLRAWAKLHPALRKHGGILSLGPAASVAYEVHGASNLSVLPIEVQHSVGVFTMLQLFDRGLLEACFSSSGDPVARAREAVAKMCGDATNTGHRDPSWLLDGSVAISPESLVPPHATAATALCQKASALRLPLKAMIQAVTAPTRLGLPYFNGDAGEQNNALVSWQKELDGLLAESAQMLTRRHDRCRTDFPALKVGRTLLPIFKGTDSEVVLADPALARPLLFYAARIDAKSLREQWRSLIANQAAQLASFQAAIYQAPAHAQVFKLTGSLPAFEVTLGKETDDIAGKLVFEALARVSPKAAGEAVGLDTLKVTLTNYEKAGVGQPIRGVSADAFL